MNRVEIFVKQVLLDKNGMVAISLNPLKTNDYFDRVFHMDANNVTWFVKKKHSIIG